MSRMTKKEREEVEKEYEHTLSMTTLLDNVRVSLWNKGDHNEELKNLDIVLLDLRLKARRLRKKMGK